MARRRSTVRFRKVAPRGIHTSPASMFTFGSDSLAAPPGAGADGCLPGGEGADGRFGLAGVAGARGGARGCAGVLPGDRRWAVVSRVRRRLWRPGGELGEAGAAAFAGAGRQAGGGAAGGVFLAGLGGGGGWAGFARPPAGRALGVPGPAGE